MHRPRVIAITDLLWGDNGKGRVTHDVLLRLLARGLRVLVVRSLGGANAWVGYACASSTAVRDVESSVFEQNVTMLVGAGTVVDPVSLMQEIDVARGFGLDVDRHVLVSDLATLVLPWHRVEERLREEALGTKKIGTTGRGIGTSFESRARRTDAVRLAQLEHIDWPLRYRELRVEALDRLTRLYPCSAVCDLIADAEEGFLEACSRLVPFLASYDRILRVYQRVDVILLEGNQGFGLDNMYGTLPYVTSTGTTPMQMAYAAMLPGVDFTLFVAKAYTTRVGEGPFVTRLTVEDEDRFRTVGGEFGSTTGRPRNVGWFDACYALYALQAMGAVFLPPERCGLAITKLDVLDGLPQVQLATAYRLGDRTVQRIPADTSLFRGFQPVLAPFPGWEGPTTEHRTYFDLPEQCRRYLEAGIVSSLGVPLRMVTAGQKPENALFLDEASWLDPAVAA